MPNLIGFQTMVQMGKANQAFIATQSNNSFVATLKSVVDPRWYMDSGASNHVVGDPNNFSHSSEHMKVLKRLLLVMVVLYLFLILAHVL